MPTYCYKFSDGRIETAERPVSERNDPLELDGQTGWRCEEAELASQAVIGTGKTWSQPREDLGVHPSQVGDLNRLLMRRGCRPAEFDKTGACVPESRKHVNDIMRARGMADRDAGYGDRAPGKGLAPCVEDNV